MKLREAGADRRENQRDKIVYETISQMKQMFNGVYGRISDLCKPIQRRYNLALTIAMGKNMDAVIVDNEGTAKDCIKYLKEQQIPPMTFIPLLSIRPKKVGCENGGIDFQRKTAVGIGSSLLAFRFRRNCGISVAQQNWFST